MNGESPPNTLARHKHTCTRAPHRTQFSSFRRCKSCISCILYTCHSTYIKYIRIKTETKKNPKRKKTMFVRLTCTCMREHRWTRARVQLNETSILRFSALFYLTTLRTIEKVEERKEYRKKTDLYLKMKIEACVLWCIRPHSAQAHTASLYIIIWLYQLELFARIHRTRTIHKPRTAREWDTGKCNTFKRQHRRV